MRISERPDNGPRKSRRTREMSIVAIEAARWFSEKSLPSGSMSFDGTATATQQQLSSARSVVQFGTAVPSSVAEAPAIKVDVAAVETREGSQVTSSQKQPGETTGTEVRSLCVVLRPMALAVA